MAKQRSGEEKKIVCNTWRQSGLSQREFCKQNRISSRSLCEWLKDIREDINDNKSGNKEIEFFPVNLSSSNNSNQSIKQDQVNKHNKVTLEITLPDKGDLRVYLSENSINTFLLELLK